MKRLMVILTVLILFIAGCGLLPPTPDANNGLVIMIMGTDSIF